MHYVVQIALALAGRVTCAFAGQWRDALGKVARRVPEKLIGQDRTKQEM